MKAKGGRRKGCILWKPMVTGKQSKRSPQRKLKMHKTREVRDTNIEGSGCQKSQVSRRSKLQPFQRQQPLLLVPKILSVFLIAALQFASFLTLSGVLWIYSSKDGPLLASVNPHSPPPLARVTQIGSQIGRTPSRNNRLQGDICWRF